MLTITNFALKCQQSIVNQVLQQKRIKFFLKITTVLTHRNNKTVDVDNVVTYDHSRRSSPSLIYALEMAVLTIFCHAHTHIELF